MQRRKLVVGVIAVALSAFYLMTARVYTEGSLGSSYLMIKPYPSPVHILGGGEEGAWARAHPNQPMPWWQSENATKLLWGGDWEDPALWPLLYSLGYVLILAFWLVLVAKGIWRAVRTQVWRLRA